jgi:hypothetical protein
MKKFNIDADGLSWNSIRAKLQGLTLISYQIPNNQNLTCTWCLRLIAEQGCVVTLSSKTGDLDGWQEVGFIKVSLEENHFFDSGISTFNPIDNFEISSARLIIYKCDEYYSECGIVLVNKQGLSITISTSPAPGAVSVDAYFNKGAFSPEFKINDCSINE